MIITWPSNTDEVIDKIRTAIGRDVTFYCTVSANGCPYCNLDPVTNTSDDSFCTTCAGEYWIPVMSGITVPAVISWGKSDILNWESGGQFLGGDCVIQINLTDDTENMVRSAKTVVVDSRIMEIKKIIRRGVKALNRILLSLVESETTDDFWYIPPGEIRIVPSGSMLD